MRVGFDITALYVAQAGVFTYRYQLARALLEHDQQHEYVLLDYVPIHGGWTTVPQLAQLRADNASVVRCRGLRHYRLTRWHAMERPGLRAVAGLVDRVLYRPWAAAADTAMAHRLSKALAGVDVFHSSDVLLWRAPDALNVVTVYDLTALLFPEYHTAETRLLQERKRRFAQDEADLVIAISEATRRDIVAHLRISPQRVHVVPAGVDPIFKPAQDRDALARALAAMGLEPGKYILYAGTLEPRKNLTRLVRAFGRMRRETPARPLKLVLAGGAGWMFGELFQTIAALGLDDCVVCPGRVPIETLVMLYRGALFFVYPSLYEGFGLPPLEAMACGTPVVASNTSSLPEVVGDAGILVDPKDEGALAEAMGTLVADSDRRSELRRAGLVQTQLLL